MGYMIGVDVGGTFTDFSIFHQETGELIHYKDSSTPSDQVPCQSLRDSTVMVSSTP